MSPTTDNFIHSLVEMSKAFEELPGVKAEAEERARQTEVLAKQVQDREESILKLKAELEAKNEAIRKVEAERDDAELRFLELDEKSAKAVRFLGQIQGMAVQAEVELNPPKPEPVKVAEPQPQSEPKLNEDHSPSGWNPNVGPAGESVSHPTPSTDHAHSADTQQDTAHSSAPISASHEGQSGSSPTPAPAAPTTIGTENEASSSKPYAGKRYVDIPGWVSFSDWIAGGGTEADYHWRG